MDYKKTVFDYLISQGYSIQGSCAIIGNLIAESNCNPCNVEDRCFLSDELYTSQVDSGKYSKDVFVNDSLGYGIAQWTYPSRKLGLYNLCMSKGVSISDINGQCEYLVFELRSDFVKLSNDLKSPDGILEDLSNRFMKQFENPAVQSSTALAYRAKLSSEVFRDFSNCSVYAHGISSPVLRCCDRRCADFPEYKIVDGFLEWYYGNSDDWSICVSAFQVDMNLNPDGVVGPQTWSKIIDCLKDGVNN